MKLRVLAVVALVIALLCAYIAYARQPPAPHPPLVTLQRVGPAPPEEQAPPAVEGQHFSQVVSSYQDLSAGSSNVWIRYSRCPATSRGAFRLTLYAAPGQPYQQHPATQYSHTLIDRRQSDSASYDFPGRMTTTYYFHVVIPGKRGCRSWSLGAPGN